MGISWRTNGDGTALATECQTFAEIVYQDDTILVVNVERSAVTDGALTDALMDAIARSEQRSEAELAIEHLAREFGMHVHPINHRDQRELILASVRAQAT